MAFLLTGAGNDAVLGGGGGWTPSSLANLAAWWKGDAGLTTSGSPLYNVTTWADQSGNANDLTGTATQATSDPAVSTLNSLPVVHSVGSTGTLKTGSFTLGGTTLSVFAVVRASATSAGRLFGLNVAGSDNGATAGCMIYHPDTTELKTQNSGATKADTGTGILTNNTYYQIGTIWDGTNSLIYVNNVQKATAANAPSFAATLTSFDVFTNPTGGNPMAGDLAEMVVVKGVIGSTDRASLASYFTTKWGV